jgi:hypothetical protein
MSPQYIFLPWVIGYIFAGANLRQNGRVHQERPELRLFRKNFPSNTSFSSEVIENAPIPLRKNTEKVALLFAAEVPTLFGMKKTSAFARLID